MVLLLAYVLLFMPRALINLQFGDRAGPGRTRRGRAVARQAAGDAFLRVTGRLAAPSALAGAALVFLGIVNELTATLLLGPNGTRTMATQFWSHVNDLDYASTTTPLTPSSWSCCRFRWCPCSFSAPPQGRSPMASVVLDGVAKAFGAVRVLEGLDLRVDDGKTVAIVGPSG